MTSEYLCRLLQWDTDFFGFNIARFNLDRLNAATVRQVLDWCQRMSVRCLYFLASPQDNPSIRLAEDHGFRLVDIRVTLQCQLSERAVLPPPSHPLEVKLRLCRAGDIPLFEVIACQSYHLSRFYTDLNFDRQRCDDLYAAWIRLSCEGRSQAVWVAEMGGQPVGYVTCELTPSGDAQGEIGLVGILPEARGCGIGSLLVDHALGWFEEQEVRVVNVVTQGRNLVAQRLYQRCGFLSQDMAYWYHRWFDILAPGAQS